jgi:anti-sigma-K factor RskA
VIDESLQEQACLYALGALSAQESKEFEALLRDSAELRAQVRELRAVAATIAGNVPALEPPASVKARLLMRIDSHPHIAASVGRAPRIDAWIPWAAAAALAVLTFAFVFQTIRLKVQVGAQDRRIEELAMSLQLAQAEVGELRHTVAKLRESNHLAAVRIALLDSLVHNEPKAVAVSVWDNERQDGLFVVRNLKPAPADKDYQLWIIDPKYPSPVDAGVFQVDADGNGREEFRPKHPIGVADKFAVTIEKKGGAEVPDTKAMVLAGA